MKFPQEKLERLHFLFGMIEGITLYAIWKDGEQLVGCMRRPLKIVLQPYRDEINVLKEELKNYARGLET